MTTVSDIHYGEDKMQVLDIHLPEEDATSVFVYFHGGCLTGGDKTNQARFFEYMTSHGVAVVSANYRLYPAAAYPKFIEDAAAAVFWVTQNTQCLSNAQKIYVGGSSAGAYLSMMLCFDSRWLSKYGLSPTSIDGFVHDSGQPTTHYKVLEERCIDSRRVIVDDSSPLYYVGADPKYPPMLLIVADDDMKNRYEQIMLLRSTLTHFGHNSELCVMHGKHCAHNNALDENGDSIFGKAVLEFISNNDTAEAKKQKEKSI